MARAAMSPSVPLYLTAAAAGGRGAESSIDRSRFSDSGLARVGVHDVGLGQREDAVDVTGVGDVDRAALALPGTSASTSGSPPGAFEFPC